MKEGRGARGAHREAQGGLCTGELLWDQVREGGVLMVRDGQVSKTLRTALQLGEEDDADEDAAAKSTP